MSGPLGGRHSLRDVIATADYINHAIPTDLEVRISVGRLSAAGLLAIDGDKLGLTPNGRELFKGKRSGSVYDARDRLRVDLRQIPVPSAASGQQLPAGTYERAVADYQESWAKLAIGESRGLADFEPLEMLGYAVQAYQAYIDVAFKTDEPDLVEAVGCLKSTLRCIEDARVKLEARLR
jgi:hypothetical protein